MEATNFQETGLEPTVVATVRYRFLLYNTNLDVFSDLGAPEPTLDWPSTLSWRLTPELSLDYKVDLRRVPTTFVRKYTPRAQHKPPGGSRAGRRARKTRGGGETGAVLSGRKGRSRRTVQQQGT